jgi:hypothetical protein
MEAITISLTIEELALLNEFIQSSTPNIKFGKATAFIASLQTQIKNQLNQLNADN